LLTVLFNPLIPAAIGGKATRQHKSDRIRTNPIGLGFVGLLIHIFHGAYLFTVEVIRRRVPSGFPYFRLFLKNLSKKDAFKREMNDLFLYQA
jgi:hypothetical protein